VRSGPTLNYVGARSDGAWAWPPLVFDNPVEKVKASLDAMREVGTAPELECFDESGAGGRGSG
jgi:3-keto-5-aminohexanoate cleavage enzyme